MTTDFRALCAELTDELADFQSAVIEAGVGWACPDTEALIDRARAALAEPESEGPTDEELLELAEGWPCTTGERHDLSGCPEVPLFSVFEDELVEFARAVLARWGHQPAPLPEGEQCHPEPVPVSERLPGPEDCDAEGRCWAWDWLAEKWCLCDRTSACHGFDHWLPAHALPLPAGEVER